jgi:hypothetical protein
MVTVAVAAEAPRHEADFQKQWAAENSGKVNVRMPDGTRCDVVTGTHAIEVEFAPKWSEAIGQSLFYALQTNKRAGIVLILRTPEDRRYLLRLNSTIEAYSLPIDVWEITPAPRDPSARSARDNRSSGD